MRLPLALPLALVLAACARDLELPPEETAPRIDAIAPAEAHAGERIVLSGVGFAADPEANLVQFARGQARGEALVDGGLRVRVPPDAGTGPLTVTTAGGTSAPAGPFGYRGLGELRTRAVAEERPLLHKPYRLLALGDTWLHSDLVLGVLRYAEPAAVAPEATSMDAAAWVGEVVRLDTDFSAGTSRLVRLQAGGVQLAAQDVAFAGFGPVVAVQGAPDRVVLFRDDGVTTTVAVHDRETLAEVEPARPVALSGLRACAAAGGRIACLARPDADGPLAIARVALPAGASPAVDWILAPGALHDDPVDLDGPLCAGPDGAGEPIAVAALEDGRLAVADLAVEPPAFRAPVATGSRTPARSLACGPGGRVVVAKTADDLVAAVDVAAGRVLWASPLARASRAAVDAGLGVVHVAGDADNVVALLDLGTGGLLARRSFDVLPGRPGAMQGAAFVSAGGVGPDLLVVACAAPQGVIEVPLQAVPGAFAIYRPSDAIGVVPPYYDGYYLTLRATGLEDAGVGSPAQLGLDGPVDMYLGTDSGLSTVQGPLAFGISLDAPEFRSLVWLPDGRVAAAVGQGNGASWSVLAWSEEGAPAGDPPVATWASPGILAGAALLDGALWAFHWSAAEDEVLATELSPSFAPLRTVALGDVMFQPIAVSPNGRSFVSWDFQPFSTDTAVVIWSGDPGLGFPRLATVPVAGEVAGAAFDESGERLYVVTRSPDRIVVLE